MTQVLEYNYGKGRFTLRQIRAAIKAVREANEPTQDAAKKPVTRKVIAAKRGTSK